MASSVNTNWNSVLSTAQAGLAATDKAINNAEKAIQPLIDNELFYRKLTADAKATLDQAIARYRPVPPYVDILDLKEAAQADPNNAAKQKAWKDAEAKFSQQSAIFNQQTERFQKAYDASLIALGNARQELANERTKIQNLYKQAEDYQAQINEANFQLGKQSSGTAPGTGNTNSATTLPASSSPGNPNTATTPPPVTQREDGSVTVNTASIASGSKKAVPSPSTAEAKPTTPSDKIVKPTKTITTTRTVTVSDGIPEALKNAPVGTQWNKPGSMDGKVKAQNLRKVGPNQYVSFASGGAPNKLDATGAAKFFRSKGLTNANNPAFMPKKVTKKITEKKTVPDTKGAPKTNDAPLDPGTGTKYTVKKGDTLSAIAKKYGITLEALLKANPQIKNPNLIKIGQVINIPGKEEEVKPFDSSDIMLAEDIQTGFDAANFEAFEDWRVRLSLAPGANYLYAGNNPGILQPLKYTKGVVFPYTPSIVVNYQAEYSPIAITHSNYKHFQYSSSSVDSVTISCDFTAQDAYEARYLLAVIHFFRTMTKMFFGQDQYPIRGTPPPLCYMYGMGGYQFSAHPLAIRDFNYNLPNDVDYIQTTAPATFLDTDIVDGKGWADYMNTNVVPTNESETRLGGQCTVGAAPPRPKFTNLQKDITTYVPTKIQLSIGCVPIMSRNQVSNYFSLDDYASGYLVKGTSRPGGGMW